MDFFLIFLKLLFILNFAFLKTWVEWFYRLPTLLLLAVKQCDSLQVDGGGEGDNCSDWLRLLTILSKYQIMMLPVTDGNYSNRLY